VASRLEVVMAATSESDYIPKTRELVKAMIDFLDEVEDIDQDTDVDDDSCDYVGETLDAPCAIRPCCVLKRELEKVRDAFIGVLDSYNLSDLVQPRGRLVNLLGISKIKALR
jgi:DNA-binding IscR family transcriptional regulator